MVHAYNPSTQDGQKLKAILRYTATSSQPGLHDSMSQQNNTTKTLRKKTGRDRGISLKKKTNARYAILYKAALSHLGIYEDSNENKAKTKKGGGQRHKHKHDYYSIIYNLLQHQPQCPSTEH